MPTNPPAGMNQRADRETSSCLIAAAVRLPPVRLGPLLHRHVGYRIAPIACASAATDGTQLQCVGDPGSEAFKQDRFRVLE